MSLQVWLPLNGSIVENIANKTFTNTNATINNAGKVGKCYYFNGSAQLVHTLSSSDISKINNLSEFTIACWVKLDSTQDTWGQILTIGSQGASWNDIRIGFDNQPNIGVHFSISDGTNNTNYGCSSNNNLQDNQWHHLIGTYYNRQLTLYVDGIQQTEQLTASFNPQLSSTSYIIIGGNAGEKPKCCLNDVRFYDHCLSPREVKLLAQGLVAHYKLDNGQPNLIKHGAEEKSGNGYCVAKYAFDKDGFGRYLNPGEQCSLTVCFTPHANFDYWFPHLNQGDIGGWIANPETTGKSDGTTNCQIVTMQSTTNWNYYNSASQVVSANDDRAEICMFAKNKSGAENNANVTIHWIKLQTGSHTDVRTFSPSLTENASLYNIEYDCSGYSNHGTKSAILEASTGSPRYSCATLFKDNKHIQTTRSNYEGMKNTYSMVYWAKHPTSSMNGKMVWGFYDGANGKYLDLYPSGGKFTLNKGDSSNLAFNVDCPIDGLWHHYAVVGDINKVYLYIDGQCKGETSSLYEIPNAPLVLSGWNTWETSTYGWNNGHISDFRLYATALSAAAIKELYQSSISFLDNGTLQCSEIVESPTNLKYNQNGITQVKSIGEIGYINEMKIKTLPDGSAWARIFYHKNRGGSVLFTAASEVLHTTSTDKFSRLDQVYHFKGPSGKYEFMLNFVELPGRASMAGQYNRWKQTNAPQDEPCSTAGSTAVVTGYEEISGQISWRDQGWGGLGCQNATPTAIASCYIDGSIGFGNWFYAIGAYAPHDSGIPGPNGGVEETELWVRIDNLPKLTQLSMFNSALQAHQIYEL